MMVDTFLTATEPPSYLPTGEFIYCPVCLPMIFPKRPKAERLKPLHITNDDPEAIDIEIRENGVLCDNVEQFAVLHGEPGVLLVEFVTRPNGSYVFCQRCIGAAMRRVRYSVGAIVSYGKDS